MVIAANALSKAASSGDIFGAGGRWRVLQRRRRWIGRVIGSPLTMDVHSALSPRRHRRLRLGGCAFVVLTHRREARRLISGRALPARPAGRNASRTTAPRRGATRRSATRRDASSRPSRRVLPPGPPKASNTASVWPLVGAKLMRTCLRLRLGPEVQPPNGIGQRRLIGQVPMVDEVSQPWHMPLSSAQLHELRGTPGRLSTAAEVVHTTNSRPMLAGGVLLDNRVIGASSGNRRAVAEVVRAQRSRRRRRTLGSCEDAVKGRLWRARDATLATTDAAWQATLHIFVAMMAASMGGTLWPRWPQRQLPTRAWRARATLPQGHV